MPATTVRVEKGLIILSQSINYRDHELCFPVAMWEVLLAVIREEFANPEAEEATPVSAVIIPGVPDDLPF
jgi:hypothetical protein